MKKQYLKNSLNITEEIYLGKEIPTNLDEIKEDFERRIRNKRFEETLQIIQKKFSNEFESLNHIAKRKFLENFAVKFTYNTQAIEGSTLSLKDTKFLVEDGIAPEKLIQDIENTKDHHTLFFEMLEYKKDISKELIYFWHKKLFD